MEILEFRITNACKTIFCGLLKRMSCSMIYIQIEVSIAEIFLNNLFLLCVYYLVNQLICVTKEKLVLTR